MQLSVRLLGRRVASCFRGLHRGVGLRHHGGMLFSQRKGLKPLRKTLQLESVDDDLRNGLWSAVFEVILKKFKGPPDRWGTERTPHVIGSNLESLIRQYWLSLFKAPTDSMPITINSAHDQLRKYFFECPWNETYDFLEFTLAYCPAECDDQFRSFCNAILERENSGYRFVQNAITEITSAAEIAGIEEALTTPVRGAQQHLAAALTLLADRKNPDYRNSIKESISAVESISRAVTGDSKATLGAALNILQPRIQMHDAMKKAFSVLYGYTSDEGGIRHAMMEKPSLSFSDAKFMLLACSGFVTFVVGKAAENKINLK